LIVPFLLYFGQSQLFSSVKFQVLNIVAVPFKVLSVPFYELKKMLFYHRIFNEYRRLRSENMSLKARLIDLEGLTQENARLEKLLEFKRRLPQAAVAARVIGRNPSNWNSSMIVDKGAEDGIRLGMPVVSDSGVVGKIAEVSTKKSKVVLLTDPQFSVAALVQRPRESGLVSGSLQGLLRMRYINERARIRLGDVVVTSALSTSFPEGLLIGEVIRVQDDLRSNSVECLIRPAVNLSAIEEVLVILTEEP
jgi:rod shape-determining protein MreC